MRLGVWIHFRRCCLWRRRFSYDGDVGLRNRGFFLVYGGASGCLDIAGLGPMDKYRYVRGII